MNGALCFTLYFKNNAYILPYGVLYSWHLNLPLPASFLIALFISSQVSLRSITLPKRAFLL